MFPIRQHRPSHPPKVFSICHGWTMMFLFSLILCMRVMDTYPLCGSYGRIPFVWELCTHTLCGHNSCEFHIPYKNNFSMYLPMNPSTTQNSNDIWIWGGCLGWGYHDVSASQSSHSRSLSSHLIFILCELHIFKLSIFSSSVFTPVISQILRFLNLNTQIFSPH